MARQTLKRSMEKTSPLSSGILQRKCDSCGRHTIAGGKCNKCQEQSALQKDTIQRKGIKDLNSLGLQHSFESKAKSPITSRSQPMQITAVKPQIIQSKLKIGAPNDAYEQEADRIADQVIRMPEPTVQRQMETEDEEEEILQTKSIASQITPLIQRKIDPDEDEKEEVQLKPLASVETFQHHPIEEKDGKEFQVKALPGQRPANPSPIKDQINALRGKGEPLPQSVRAYFEPRFGVDFSAVRIHKSSKAAATARSINARAFTLGRDIIFGNNDLNTGEGRRLLAHELTHVLQQMGGNSVQMMGQQIQRAPALSGTRASVEEIGEDWLGRHPKLERRFESLSDDMRYYLASTVHILENTDIPNDLYQKAQKSVRKFRRIWRTIVKARLFDSAVLSQWLKQAIRTLRALKKALLMARKHNLFGETAGYLVRDTKNLQSRAFRLLRHDFFKRGAAWVEKHGENQEQEAREQQEQQQTKEALAKVASQTQLQTIKMKDYEIDLEIQKLMRKRYLENDSEKIKVIDEMIKVLEKSKVEKSPSPETPIVAIEDRLTTIERQDREYTAQLTNEMNISDLMRLVAETPNGRERLGNLGLRLAESTSFEGTAEILGSLLPGFGDDLANIATGRFEGEKAVKHLSRAIARTGGSSEMIVVTDAELTGLRIERSGEYVSVSKIDYMKGIELSDPSTRNKDIKSNWIFAPSDLVTFTVPSSGQSVTLPAFGLLHIKNKGLIETYKTWAALLEVGVGFTRASVAATKAQLSVSSNLADASKITSPLDARSRRPDETLTPANKTNVGRAISPAKTPPQKELQSITKNIASDPRTAVRKVNDPVFRAEGYIEEVKAGGNVVYRRHKNGTWCRFNSPPDCGFDINEIIEEFRINEDLSRRFHDPLEDPLTTTGLGELSRQQAIRRAGIGLEKHHTVFRMLIRAFKKANVPMKRTLTGKVRPQGTRKYPLPRIKVDTHQVDIHEVWDASTYILSRQRGSKNIFNQFKGLSDKEKKVAAHDILEKIHNQFKGLTDEEKKAAAHDILNRLEKFYRRNLNQPEDQHLRQKILENMRDWRRRANL